MLENFVKLVLIIMLNHYPETQLKFDLVYVNDITINLNKWALPLQNFSKKCLIPVISRTIDNYIYIINVVYF